MEAFSGLIPNKKAKIFLMFGVSRMEGNTEHRPFF
jgi:hypothetical protein